MKRQPDASAVSDRTWPEKTTGYPGAFRPFLHSTTPESLAGGNSCDAANTVPRGQHDADHGASIPIGHPSRKGESQDNFARHQPAKTVRAVKMLPYRFHTHYDVSWQSSMKATAPVLADNIPWLGFELNSTAENARIRFSGPVSCCAKGLVSRRSRSDPPTDGRHLPNRRFRDWPMASARVDDPTL